MFDKEIISKAFDEIPIIAFVVDDDVRIEFSNREAKKVIDSDAAIYARRGGEVLKCAHSTAHESGCGHAPECGDCLIRNSVIEARRGAKTFRQHSVLKLKKQDGDMLFHALITTTPFEFGGKPHYLLMIENVCELMMLKDLIPICSSCKKIRNDEDYWTSGEECFNRYISVDFTHAICPECIEKLYPEVAAMRKNKQAVILEQ